jgi:hypothetical protein
MFKKPFKNPLVEGSWPNRAKLIFLVIWPHIPEGQVNKIRVKNKLTLTILIYVEVNKFSNECCMDLFKIHQRF